MNAVTALAALAHKSRLAVFRWLVQAGPAGGNPGDIAAQLDFAPATLEIPAEGIDIAGRTVVIIDDVLATGGTVAATNRLLTSGGAMVRSAAVVLELTALGGREVVQPLPVSSLYTV